MALGAAAYAAAFVAAVLLSWLLTPVMLRVAVRRDILDLPDARKAHSSPVPYLGGVAIVVAFSVTVLVAGALTARRDGVVPLAWVLGAAVALSVVGLVDDLRGLSPYLRLGVEVVAGVIVYTTDPGTLLGPPSVNLAVTVLWVVGVTNAFNLLDNMDGLSAGVGAIAALSFCVIAAVNGQFLVAALAAAVAGCATGFLRHNFHPAKIYMGDAGSLFLGFLLAAIGIRLRLVNAPPPVAVFVPVLVLGVALFDTTLVTVNRLHHRLSPMQGGRDHASHRLVWVGIPIRVSVGLIYGVAVSLGFLALLLTRLDATSGLMLVGFVMAVAVGTMALLSAVPVYQTSRRRQTMLRLVRDHEPAIGSAAEPAQRLG